MKSKLRSKRKYKTNLWQDLVWVMLKLGYITYIFLKILNPSTYTKEITEKKSKGMGL